MKISVIIITKDEEEDIGKCLESVKNIADEIIVVDSGSKDKTVEICNKYGAKVFYKPFINYSIQKNFAITKTSNDWILSIDADEFLSEPLIRRIQKLKEEGFKASGYLIRRQNMAFGFAPKHWWEYHLRLFNKTKGKFVDLAVHEYVKVDGKVEYIHEPIMHYTYKTINEQLTKGNKYSEMEAEQIKRRANILSLYLKPLLLFLFFLFKKKLILDGIPGIHFAIMAAFYRYLVEFRVWVNNNQKSKK